MPKRTCKKFPLYFYLCVFVILCEKIIFSGTFQRTITIKMLRRKLVIVGTFLNPEKFLYTEEALSSRFCLNQLIKISMRSVTLV